MAGSVQQLINTLVSYGIDDENVLLPPEGILGPNGFVTQDTDIGKLPKGKYTVYMEFYTIPHYKQGKKCPT